LGFRLGLRRLPNLVRLSSGEFLLKENGLAGLVDEARIVEGQPVLEVGVGHLDVEAFALLADEGGRLEPGLKAVGVDLVLNFEQDLKPRIRFVGHDRNADIFPQIFPQLWKLFFPLEGRFGLLMIANRIPDFKDFFRIVKILIGYRL
jgi:hypothetical protein